MSFAGFMDFARKDVNLLNSSPTVFLKKLHSDFIYKYEKDRDSYVSLFKLFYSSGDYFFQSKWK